MSHAGWTDLSHTLINEMPRIPAFPPPKFERFLSQPENPMNVTHIDMVCHVGTHVDAPCHFIADGPSMDQIGLDRLSGPGVVCRVDAEGESVLGVEHLRDREQIDRGDIVVLRTGWAQYFGDARYDNHPSLSIELAHWLVEREVKLVAVDMPTPDLAVERRGAGFDWPVHQILLGAGILISEHVTNLEPLAGRRVEAMFAPISIGGADGGPVRAIARPV